MRARPETNLSEQDLVRDNGGICPLCKSESSRRAVFRIQDDPEISWVSCPDCRGYSASRMPTSRYLSKYYQDYYQSAPLKVTVGRPAKLARHVASLLPESLEGRLSILDFGGGDGTVAKLLARDLRRQNRTTSSEITVVDFTRERAKETADYSLRFESDLESLHGQQFDLVLASAVIEHVPEVCGLLETLFELLAPLGAFYARTPTVTPLKRLYGGYPLNYPMHVHDLGPSYWNRVCHRYPGLQTLVSQPSMVASRFSRADFARSSLAYLMKIPARVESRLRRSPTDYFWKLVGGWEILLQRKGTPTRL